MAELIGINIRIPGAENLLKAALNEWEKEYGEMPYLHMNQITYNYLTSGIDWIKVTDRKDAGIKALYRSSPIIIDNDIEANMVKLKNDYNEIGDD